MRLTKSSSVPRKKNSVKLSLKKNLHPRKKSSPLIRIEKLPIQSCVNWNKVIAEFNEARKALFGSIGRRKRILWEWLYTGGYMTRIDYANKSTPEYLEDIATSAKTLGAMWDVLIDDIADDMEIEKAQYLLPYALHTDKPLLHLTPQEKKYIEYIHLTKKKTYSLLQQLPGFKKHLHSINQEYDALKKVFEYSLQLRSDNQYIDIEKCVTIISNNMHMIINGIIDLMKLNYYQDFRENPSLKNLLFYAQRMGRIGNHIATYEYEIKQGDYSNELIALLVAFRFVERKDLQDKDFILAVIKKLNIEELLWEIWKRYKIKLKGLENQFPTLDMKLFISGITKVRKFHRRGMN